jgi:hypothetical protein
VHDLKPFASLDQIGSQDVDEITAKFAGRTAERKVTSPAAPIGLAHANNCMPKTASKSFISTEKSVIALSTNAVSL